MHKRKQSATKAFSVEYLASIKLNLSLRKESPSRGFLKLRDNFVIPSKT